MPGLRSCTAGKNLNLGYDGKEQELKGEEADSSIASVTNGDYGCIAMNGKEVCLPSLLPVWPPSLLPVWPPSLLPVCLPPTRPHGS